MAPPKKKKSRRIPELKPEPEDEPRPDDLDPSQLPDKTIALFEWNLSGLGYRVCTEQLKAGVRLVAQAMRDREIIAEDGASYLDQLLDAHTRVVDEQERRGV